MGYILFPGFVPWLELTGALIEPDGSRTTREVYVRIRKGRITGVDWLD
jgi:hypothetical protein